MPGSQDYRERVNCSESSSTELSRAARMNTPTPPKCLSIEINDVTGSAVAKEYEAYH